VLDTFDVIYKNETCSTVGTLVVHVFTERQLQADVKVLKIFFIFFLRCVIPFVLVQ